jgi:hypothetical protein
MLPTLNRQARSSRSREQLTQTLIGALMAGLWIPVGPRLATATWPVLQAWDRPGQACGR